MALRDWPYLPLYVKDFVSDEKLVRCCASTIGVYIWLMCYMHKSDKYGVFAIRERDRVSDDILDDFARVFSSFSPFSQGTVQGAFQELIDENIVFIKRNWLCQKRMMKDGELSDTRSKSGKAGMHSRYKKEEENDDEFCYSKTANKTLTKYVNANANANANANEELNKKGVAKIEKIEFAEFVHMTNAEHDKLVVQFGTHGAQRCIEILDNYKGSSGKKYKSDYRAILSWVAGKYGEECRSKPQPAERRGNYV